MTKKTPQLLAGFLLVVFSACKEKTEYAKKPELFHHYAKNFLQASIQLDKTAAAFKIGNVEKDSLRRTLKNTRVAYKKVEFWIAYRYPGYAKSHFNGAPLLHIEKSGNDPSVLPPKGLQVLDELIFSENVETKGNKIASLAKTLHNKYKILYADLKNFNPDPQELLNAVRMQLVRIFTLGVTGFDTPGSLNVLPEAKSSLKAMCHFLAENFEAQKPNELKNILTLFDEAVEFVEHSGSFENFDRLTFLTEYIDPLYKKMGVLQKKPSENFLTKTTPWNPQSNSLFADNFLNPYFFTELKKKEDSPELRALGKSLFYDPIISANGKMSCATCHRPEKAFTDGRAKSISNVHGKTVLRNAPTLLNAVYADRYFYDLRAFTLEQQVEHVIFNPLEFNTAYDEILKKLKADEEYSQKFKAIFGKNGITRGNFTQSLSSYVLSLRSFNSEFDRYVRGEIEQVDAAVKNGFNLFMGKANCATCHFPPTFSGLVPPFYIDSESEILGVLENPNAKNTKVDDDMGRYANGIDSEKAWIYKKSFKTTTVRNVELTAPYFHNGAYNDLQEMMEFYNAGGGMGLGHKVSNQTLSADSLDLTEKEIADLIAFMESLTDNRKQIR